MRRINRRTAWTLALGCLAGPALSLQAALPPARPFPQHTAYAAGSILPSQRPRSELDAQVVAAYFRWKGHYLARAGQESDGHPRYRVVHSPGPDGFTVSEGQGYGMVIVALLAGAEPEAQTIFDGLWEYFNDHRSAIDRRLMDWKVAADESRPTPGEDDSAFDGDCDIAYALLLAEAQWGSSGRIDYRREAAQTIAGIRESTIGAQSHLPLLGDWVGASGPPYGEGTPRSSDFIPDHFRAFARFTGDAVWAQVLAAVASDVTSLQDRFSPATGLLPDFIVRTSDSDPRPKPAPPSFLEAETDGAYSYNAGRDPWRLGVDALLNGDPGSRKAALAITRWARAATGGTPRSVQAGYRLDGSALPGSDYFSTFFVAPLGVAAQLDANLQPWLNAIWEAVQAETQGYYEDSVTLLSLLVMSGNAWDPTLFSPGVACSPVDALCLSGYRFEVTATWTTTRATSGRAHPIELTGDTGTFWFFDPANVEVVIKVLDGCGVNGHIWVFAGGLTDVRVDLTIRDTRTGAVRTYRNPQGAPFQPIQDTAAFSACP
jgi:hypothetical protein